MSLDLGGVNWHGEDTADTGSAVDRLVVGDPDVTFHTPGGSPRVLDQEGRSTVFSSVSDSSDGVVNLVATSGLDDTGLVELEDVLAGLDTDNGWLLVKGSLELGGRLGLNVGVTLVLEDNISRVVLALAGDVGDGVVSEAFNTVLFSVFEGVVEGVASVASVAFGGTIDELLGGEGFKGVSLEEPEGFQRSSSSEGPASTALFLVLDVGDGSLFNPVDGGFDVFFIEADGFEVVLEGFSSVDVDALDESAEFFRGHVSELVKTKFDIRLHGVVGLDEVVVGSEDTESVGIFFGSFEVEVVLSLPGLVKFVQVFRVDDDF